MILGDSHEEVVQNIKDAVREGKFHKKVETGDPNLTGPERRDLIDRYLKKKTTLRYSCCNLAARLLLGSATWVFNRRTRIEGREYLSEVKGGAIVTSNHFNPIDNTVVRYSIGRAFHRRLFIVSQDTNLAMKGLVGFLMRYSDIIPLSSQVDYVREHFGPTIRKKLKEDRKILIYPEQEMWLNYRKPRPPKRGAYYYAALNGVPVISCFVEIQTRPEKETEEFYRTRFIMHILPPIYPDPEKNPRENSIEMMETDYRQKVEAYEKAYGRTLTYDFEPGDIAGWAADER